MNGKAIRARAEKQIKNRRLFLFCTLLLAGLPQFLYLVILRLGRFSPPPWPGKLVSQAAGFLMLGAIAVAMEQAEGKEKSLSGMVFHRQGEVIKKPSF